MLRLWRILSGLLSLSLALTALTMSTATSAQKGDPNPRIIPVWANHQGLSYGEWSAKWWQWAYSLPITNHPLYDTAPCSTGQSGHVWFLGGSFTTTERDGRFESIVTRECTVPTGTSLFFPIINVESAELEGAGSTEDALRANAGALMDMVVSPPAPAGPSILSCEIDGRPVQNIMGYRVQSPLFTYGPLPNNSVLEDIGYTVAEGDTSIAVGDGIYLMLAPLPTGSHTIHFRADVPVFTFLLDVTYHITVVPGRK